MNIKCFRHVFSFKTKTSISDSMYFEFILMYSSGWGKPIKRHNKQVTTCTIDNKTPWLYIILKTLLPTFFFSIIGATSFQICFVILVHVQCSAAYNCAHPAYKLTPLAYTYAPPSYNCTPLLRYLCSSAVKLTLYIFKVMELYTNAYVSEM